MSVYVCKLQLWGRDGVLAGRRRFAFVFSVLPADHHGSAMPAVESRILRVHVCVDSTILERSHWKNLEHRELLAQVYSFARQRLQQLGPVEQDELRFEIDEFTEQGHYLINLPTTCDAELGVDFPVSRRTSARPSATGTATGSG